MKSILLILILTFSLSESQIISRNNKIQEIYDKYQEQLKQIDELIKTSQQKIGEDYKICSETPKSTNCSHLKVYQHERSKHSKNITNLQNKIVSHQQTIQKIIQLNQEETHKKSLILKRLLPELIKAKNDIEYIEGIQFLIKDTYLNIDEPEVSILNIFDSHYGNAVQTQLAQMLAKRYDHDPGARPQQQDYLPEKEEELPVAKKDYFQGPPLIDEVIFDGHNEHYPEASVRDLFNSLGGVNDDVPVADLIPEGVNVPEHDQDKKKIGDIVREYKEYKEGEDPFENLQVIEIQQDFKLKIKEQGQRLFDKLEALRKSLKEEQDRIAQAVADLEKAIINLHTRHAKQIVQIYIESKRLQREVFEKDDIVLHLDSLIHDCTNLEQKVKKCSENKLLTQAYIRDLEQQKELNLGILKELQKLHQYPDKNIETPVVPIEEIEPTSAQAEAIKKEIQQSQDEMHQIADAEADLKKEDNTAEAAQSAPAQSAAQPTTAEPAAAQPTTAEPAAQPTAEPVAAEPAAAEPVAAEPVATEPVAAEPVATEPVATEPVATEPVATESAAPQLLANIKKHKKSKK